MSPELGDRLLEERERTRRLNRYIVFLCCVLVVFSGAWCSVRR